ncbi:cobalt-precorrin-6A synthase [Clostridiales bacterium PH28_bin88]|nr:cobalt-precorrin-6A synthase [Clostridiales bacterium PH28_bin88]
MDYRLHRGKLWRRGYTTGSCAAAAAKAALIALREGEFPNQVEIELPAGKKAVLKIAATESHPDGMACAVVKDGGDDPDVTHGLEIWAKASWMEGGINIKGGAGVGTVTGPGLPVPVGYPAINPVPMSMIQKEVAGELPPGKGTEITIFVPGGEEAAARTLNPKLGIIGGISILGTSGIVEPMSEEAFKASLVPQIKSALGLGFGTVVLTPGRMGQLNAENRGLPGGAVVQMSNFVGFMLEECARLGVKGVILFGHIGKLVKVAAGIFHTHNRMADARLETLAAWAIKLGVPSELARRVMETKTVEEAVQGLLSSGYGNIFPELAAGASQRAREYVRGSMEIGTVLTSLPGEILGMDETAVRLGRDIGWKV